MIATFLNCTSLIGEIEINATIPEDQDCGGQCQICRRGYDCFDCWACCPINDCFAGTVQPIVLTGSCSRLQDFPKTGSSYSVTTKAETGNEVFTHVPAGCTYITANGITFPSGTAMPANFTLGDQLITADYTYMYIDGWFVTVNDKTKAVSTIPTGTNQQTQGTTAPETSVPGTSAPETTVPETTVPATTVPETTAPETTVPGTSAPETTAPETTVPETTVPETTVPETTVPETTVPETTAPVETQPPVTQPPVTEPPVTEPEEVVYVEADVANSIKIGESWINNTPEPGEATTIGRIYVFSTAKEPVCSICSLEVVSASLNGKAAEVLQTSSKENAQAFLVNKGAAGIVETEALLVTQIMCSLEAGEEPINFEVIIRASLENGQTLELRFVENRLQYGSGGIFGECDPEDFQ